MSEPVFFQLTDIDFTDDAQIDELALKIWNEWSEREGRRT